MMQSSNRIISSTVFAYYADYFHDGSIFKFTKTEKGFSIEMESAPLYACDNRDDIPLSKDNTLYGIVHIADVLSMKHNKKSVDDLEMKHDFGDVIDFKIDSCLFVCGDWQKRGGIENYEKRIWFEIEVEAKKIYWENTANIEDPSLYGQYKGITGPPPFGEYPQWYIDKYGLQNDNK